MTSLTATQRDIIGANEVRGEVIRTRLAAGGGGLVLVLTQGTQLALTALFPAARRAWRCATQTGAVGLVGWVIYIYPTLVHSPSLASFLNLALKAHLFPLLNTE